MYLASYRSLINFHYNGIFVVGQIEAFYNYLSFSVHYFKIKFSDFLHLLSGRAETWEFFSMDSS